MCGSDFVSIHHWWQYIVLKYISWATTNEQYTSKNICNVIIAHTQLLSACYCVFRKNVYFKCFKFLKYQRDGSMTGRSCIKMCCSWKCINSSTKGKGIGISLVGGGGEGGGGQCVGKTQKFKENVWRLIWIYRGVVWTLKNYLLWGGIDIFRKQHNGPTIHSD